ncbi:uncharacterized protein LOC110862788 [Folsomia candida]|uniref:Chitin-binding type-4 domain-containing protein n=1 Tax=Folsomia candida TaxID=158441 RepID=A0A226CX18_FOLCA|nr:uncharacterized protein LOC110862787 [Folsomia candida]XP_021967688.1 uncharacterized protein LOC110862788 [Folsomia candida]OXA36941.1 hypothetical protein Fcan01_28277 [Folsomia candida]OXA36946.1 hypothetical protein Fcan01_28279 [Folsomia candida]
MKILLIFGVVCSAGFFYVEGHGTLREPPQRSSVWRDERFASLNPTPNYDDGGLWCAGEKQDYAAEACGVCGDGFSVARPRPNENGGTYANGIITGRYRRGEEIPIAFELTAQHNGYFSVQICDDLTLESHECFQRRGFLPLAGGTTTKIDVTNRQGFVNTTVQLPPDLSCQYCVLRLYYRSCKDWGECDGVCDCPNPPGAMCCGPQEVVLNCADISVSL